MSFTQSSHIIVTFNEYNVPDKKSVGSEFNGANIAKEIWFAFTDETLINYTVVVNAKRADGDLGYRLCSKKTVDGVSYDYLKIDSWFTEKVGKVILAVKVYKSSDITVNEDGTYTLLEDEPLIVVGDLFHLVVNYAPNADSLVAPFDPSDMQVIMAAIGNKASKSEVPLIVTALPSDLDTLIDGVYKYDGWFFMLTDGTLYRIDDDTATFIGKIGESVKYVKSSEILAKGNVVQLDTATGGFVQVKKAVPSEINVRPQLILGFALQAFTANGWGLILMQGYLSGIDTSGASADGDLVYFDSSNGTAGLFTFTRPTPPKAIVVLGTVSNDNVNGSIDVRISTMPMSDQVNHDVTPTNYSSSTQTVKENLKGIDTAIGALNTFKDTTVPSTYIPLSQKAAINGVATLGADGKVPDAQMPNITITDTNVVNSQALMLALTAQVGDVCVRTDLNKSYILKTAPATVLGNWQELLTPTDSVLSVAGKTGAVTLVKADVGLGNVDNTSDLNKPISTATQTALDTKAGKFYATNLCTNGHPTANTTGYTAVNSTLGYGASGLTSLASAQNGGFTRAITTVVGRIYHFHAKITAPIGTTITFGTTVLTTTQATIQLLSGSFTATATSTNLVLADVRASGWTTIYFDYGVIVDKTTLYGAGSEPTQVEMDKYLAQKFTNSYFDGTAEYATLADITGNKATAIKATNCLKGTNFDATTYWGTVNGALTVSSNKLIVTSSGANTTMNGYQLATNAYVSQIIGHKYFVKTQLISSINATKFIITCGGNNVDFQTAGIVASTTYTYSGIHIPTSSTGATIIFEIASTDLTGATLSISKPIIIDLTATFGAGKEPTVAQMNADLAYYTNSWFDGTVPFITLYTLNATKCNRQQEDRLVPTLTNATVSTLFSYRKDGMGYVDIIGILAISGTGTNFTLPTGYRPLVTMKYCITKDDGTGGYCQIATTGVFTSYATGTFHINIRFPTV